MATFNPTIELANDSMSNGRDIADALMAIRHDVRDNVDLQDKRYGANQVTIRDNNGNTVGQWTVREDGEQ